MSTAHRIAYDLFKAEASRISAVNAEHIFVDASPLIINLQSAGAETRTLDAPKRQDALLTLHHQIDGGDITVTVTNNYDETGDSTFVFSDEGQFAIFQSMMTSAGVYFWRLISHYGIANITPAIAAGLVAAGTPVATPVAGVAAGYKIARGVTALDGSNPTPVATGLITVVAAVVTLEGTAAPGVGTTTLTIASTNYATGALAVYAWKPTSNADPTLVASTGTENFEWVAVGT